MSLDDLRSTTHPSGVERVANAIAIPPEKWPNRCNEIALKLLGSGLVAGLGAQNRYGHWLGPVTHRWFPWIEHLPFHRHGWLELPDGTVIDPTRWCFTGEDPYIYAGPNTGEYDWGGDSLRETMYRDVPWPECDPQNGSFHRSCVDEPVELTPLFVEEVITPVASLFEMDDPDAPIGQPNSTLRTCQLFWVCNQPRSVLNRSDDSKAVIRYLIRDGHKAKLPADTAQWATGASSALSKS